MKKELRKQILQLRDALTDEERHEKSKAITNRILNHPKFQSADCILLFASYKSEVDTTAIMEHALALGKPLYFPRVESKEMEFYRIFSPEDLYEGYKGIREPKPQEELRFCPSASEKVLILMPGAVFDLEGNRIGYGGGFYDRFLERLKKCMRSTEEAGICNVALAFECQIVENGMIEAELHDIRVDYIVTEDTITPLSLEL